MNTQAETFKQPDGQASGNVGEILAQAAAQAAISDAQSAATLRSGAAMGSGLNLGSSSIGELVESKLPKLTIGKPVNDNWDCVRIPDDLFKKTYKDSADKTGKLENLEKLEKTDKIDQLIEQKVRELAALLELKKLLENNDLHKILGGGGGGGGGGSVINGDGSGRPINKMDAPAPDAGEGTVPKFQMPEGKPTLPNDRPGSVNGIDLEAIRRLLDSGASTYPEIKK